MHEKQMQYYQEQKEKLLQFTDKMRERLSSFMGYRDLSDDGYPYNKLDAAMKLYKIDNHIIRLAEVRETGDKLLTIKKDLEALNTCMHSLPFIEIINRIDALDKKYQEYK